MADGTQVLNDLLDTLDQRISAAQGAGPADAIGRVLAEPARTTAVTSLHDAPVVEAFRQALSDGLIRVDTANQLLQLLNTVIVKLIP